MVYRCFKITTSNTLFSNFTSKKKTTYWRGPKYETLLSQRFLEIDNAAINLLVMPNLSQKERESNAR